MRIKHSLRDPESLPKPDGERDTWGLHNGWMRLYLHGPGVNTWWPVTSARSDTSRHGSERERAIAKKAVRDLAIEFRDSIPTLQDVREALERHGWKPCPYTIYPDQQ
jgi:hypothetical protein